MTNLLKYLLHLLFFFVVLQPTEGQVDSCNYIIEGAVYDQATRLPLAYATVQLTTVTGGVYTDAEGGFSFPRLCAKEHDLRVSYVGYKTVTHHHDFYHPFVKIYLAPEKTLLESIVVEAERTERDLATGTSTKISGKALAAVKTESFGEVVSQLPGVSTISTGQNIAKPIIHGLHSNRVLIMNNGLRHEFQNWGVDHAPEIDPGAMREIEVVKGAATVRFGPEALGWRYFDQPRPH